MQHVQVRWMREGVWEERRVRLRLPTLTEVYLGLAFLWLVVDLWLKRGNRG